MALTKSGVSELYVAIFNRASEGAGNTFWQGYSASATSAEIADIMLGTDDAKVYFGDSLDSDQAFIEHIYQNTLGKTVAEDEAGVAFWVDELATKSRGEVVARLIEAAMDPQYAGSDAQNLFLNMIAVSDFAADTLEDAPADLNALRFDAGLQGVTADPATVKAANAKVEQVLNPVDPLTQALNELEAAKKDLKDFETAAEKNELVNKLGGDVSKVQSAAVVAIARDAKPVEIDPLEDSAAVIQAKIGDTVTFLNNALAAEQKVLDAASAEVAKVAGLPNALLQLAARGETAKVAGEALEPAKKNYDGEIAKFNAKYTVLASDAIENYGTVPTAEAPKLADGFTEAKYPGITELLNAAVADYAAKAASAAANEALAQAKAAVLYLDAQDDVKKPIAEAIADAQGLVDPSARTAFVEAADKLTQKQVYDALNKALKDHGAGDDLYIKLQAAITDFEDEFDNNVGDTSDEAIDARADVVLADSAIEAFNKKLADLLAATEMQGELKAKADAVDAAVDAFEELGVEVPQSLVAGASVVATAGSDLFLSDTAGTILYFGQQGEDRLWVGEANELVVLGASNDIAKQPLGDSSVLEVFAKQTATGVDLWVEKQAFAGNATLQTDLVKITLSGISADDLVLEDGFLSIA